MLNKEDKVREVIFNIYLIILFAVLLLPSLRFIVPYFLIVVLFLCYYIFYLIYFVRTDEDNKEMIFMLSCAAIMTSMYLFVTYFGDVGAALKEFTLIARLFCPYFVLKYALGMKKDCKIALIGFLAIIVLIFLSTMLALLRDPMIARLLAEGGNDASLAPYRNQNVGGFNYCYLYIVIIPTTLFFAIKSNNALASVILTILLVLEYVFVFMTQYATLVVFCLIIGVVSCFLFTKNKVLRVVMVAVAVLMILIYSNIFDFILQNVQGDMLISKLEGIFSVIRGDSSLDDITSRTGLHKIAFDYFLRSPIWGTPHYVDGVAMYELSSHSTFLELLQTTGLIGFCTYYGSLIFLFVKTKKYIKEETRVLFAICFIAVLFLSYFNPIHYFYEMQITLFLVLPLLLRKGGEL